MDKKYIDNAVEIIKEKLNKEYILETKILNIVEGEYAIEFDLYLKTSETSFEESLIILLDYMEDDDAIVRVCAEILDDIIKSFLSKSMRASGDTRRFNINQILIFQDVLDKIKI